MVGAMDKNDVMKIKDEIIQAALPEVLFDGWTWETVQGAAGKAGYNEETAAAVFPGGLIDVLDGFADMADREMLKRLEMRNPQEIRVRDRIHAGVMERFFYLRPYREQLRQSLTYWAVPTRKPRALKIVWRSADRIWDWAGDTATDYNRYTKRGLLSGVLISTTLVFTGDESENLQDTEDFLARRIKNVMQAGRLLGKIKGKVQKKSRAV